MPLQDQERRRKQLRSFFTKYTVPQLDEDGNLIQKDEDELEEKKKELSENSDSEKGLSSEDEADDEISTEIDSYVTLNTGLPIALIANKSDLIHGQMAEFYKDRFDFIVRHLREYILMYGGSLFTVSSLNLNNMDTFGDYLLNRWQPMIPELNNREILLIPAGFDNTSMIKHIASDN